MAAEIQHIYLEHPQQRLIKRAVDFLKEGKIILYPTDTLYGLGADVLQRDSFSRILKIKSASHHKLLTLICPDLKDISNWAVVPDLAYKVMRRAKAKGSSAAAIRCRSSTARSRASRL